MAPQKGLMSSKKNFKKTKQNILIDKHDDTEGKLEIVLINKCSTYFCLMLSRPKDVKNIEKQDCIPVGCIPPAR